MFNKPIDDLTKKQVNLHEWIHHYSKIIRNKADIELNSGVPDAV
jgi:hypothetical protein